MAFGRPTEFKPEYCKELVEHMRKGLSFESFAGKCEVSKQCIYNWLEKFPEFVDAKRTGTELSRLFWEEMGNSGANGDKKNFNCSAWIFNMKNRFRDEWKDRSEVDHTGGVLLGAASREQIANMAAQALIEKSSEKLLNPAQNEDDD